MIVVVFCGLAMIGVVTAYKRAGRRIDAAMTSPRILVVAEELNATVREAIIQHELAIWDSVPPELLPDLITHTPEDFDD